MKNTLFPIITALTLSATTLLFSHSANADAYEIPSTCEAAKPFKKVSGNCDNKGLLQGQGSVIVSELQKPYSRAYTLLVGNFKDGLPHGKIKARRYEWGYHETNPEKPKDIPENEAIRTCMLDFDNGILVKNQSVTCTSTTHHFNNKPLQTIITPLDDKGIRAVYENENNIYLYTESLAKVELNNILYLPFEKNKKQLGNFVGEIKGFVFREYSDKATKLKGTLNYQDGKKLQGSFKFENCNQDSGSIYCQAGLLFKANIDEKLDLDDIDDEYIYTYHYTKDGKPRWVKFVIKEANYPSDNIGKFAYYKDDTGLEFNGLCDYCYTKYEYNGTEFKLTPYTGKITDKNGKVAFFKKGDMTTQ